MSTLGYQSAIECHVDTLNLSVKFEFPKRNRVSCYSQLDTLNLSVKFGLPKRNRVSFLKCECQVWVAKA